MGDPMLDGVLQLPSKPWATSVDHRMAVISASDTLEAVKKLQRIPEYFQPSLGSLE